MIDFSSEKDIVSTPGTSREDTVRMPMRRVRVFSLALSMNLKPYLDIQRLQYTNNVSKFQSLAALKIKIVCENRSVRNSASLVGGQPVPSYIVSQY